MREPGLPPSQASQRAKRENAEKEEEENMSCLLKKERKKKKKRQVICKTKQKNKNTDSNTCAN